MHEAASSWLCIFQQHDESRFSEEVIIVQEAYVSFIDAFSSAGSSSNKAVRSSWASLLVNISLMLSAPGAQTASASEGLAIVLSAVAELLSTCPEDDAETLAR